MQRKGLNCSCLGSGRLGCEICPFTQMPSDRKLGGVLPAKLGVTNSPFKH